MPEMPRAEHLAWAKQRALAYVERGELVNAVASMISDLEKHKAFATPSLSFLALVGMREIHRGPEAVRHWIEGFN
jgi:hypothetical protein